MNNNQNNNYNNNMSNYPNNNYNNNNGYNTNNNGYVNKDRKPLSHYIKNFLLVFLGFVLIIFILLWLFPTKTGLKDTLTDALNPLYDKIYQENINNMKEAAITYYTTDRLPTIEGSSKSMTLGQMLDKKLLLDVKDKNGNMCNSEESYVKITKNNKEYKMKVNLKCGAEEKYVIVYLGCYSYCDQDICEKQIKQIVKATPKKTIINKIFKSTNKKYYCQIVNGKYYDVNGKIVGKITYEKSCYHKPAPKYYCKIVNGKYYDKNGNIVSKRSYEKSCNKPTPTPKYYCKIVNGKYYDKNGNIVSKNEYIASCYPKPEKKYIYKYAKNVHYEKEYSNWTDWSSKIAYDPDDNSINWGKHETNWYEKLPSETTYIYEPDRTKPITQTVNEEIGTYSKWACNEYDYFIDSTTYTTYTTSGTNGGWSYAETITTSKVPSSTNTTKYVFAGINYSNCGTLCNVSPSYKFHKYTRTVSTTTTTSSTSSSSLSAVCKKVVKKDIPIYALTDEVVGYDVKKTPKTVYYYHYKTRYLIHDEYDKISTTWSYSKHDEYLINMGYHYTGIHKEIN